MISLQIDGREVNLPEQMTLLKAAQLVGIKIPTLCYNQHLEPYGGCRLCVVEITSEKMRGRSRLMAACAYPAEEGLIVSTNSERVQKARKFVVQLLLASTPDSEEMQAIAAKFEVTRDGAGGDLVGDYLLRRANKPESTKCIKCGLCVRVCAEFVGMSATCFAERGTQRKVKTPFGQISPTCIGCGACAYLCPTRAIRIEPADSEEG